MIYSVQQIKFDIQAYIKEFGGNFQEWCIGIASCPKRVMREVHFVDETQDIWLCKQAISHRACQTVKAYFTEKLCVEGVANAGGAEEGYCIFLFRKSSRTIPCSLGASTCDTELSPFNPVDHSP